MQLPAFRPWWLTPYLCTPGSQHILVHPSMGLLTQPELVHSFSWFYVDCWRTDNRWRGMKLGSCFGTKPAATKLIHLHFFATNMNWQKRGHSLLESILGTLKPDLFSDQTPSGFSAQSTNYLFTRLAWETSINVLNKETLKAEWGKLGQGQSIPGMLKMSQIRSYLYTFFKKIILSSLWLVFYLGASTDC